MQDLGRYFRLNPIFKSVSFPPNRWEDSSFPSIYLSKTRRMEGYKLVIDSSEQLEDIPSDYPGKKTKVA